MPGHGKRQGGQLAVPPKKKKKLRQSKDDARRVNGACALFAMRHALVVVLRREVTDMELVSALAAAANDAATKARDAPSRVEGEAMAVALADPAAAASSCSVRVVLTRFRLPVFASHSALQPPLPFCLRTNGFHSAGCAAAMHAGPSAAARCT